MPALYRGDFSFVEGVPEDVLAYTRSIEGSQVLVVVNTAGSSHTLDLSALGGSAQLLLSSRCLESGAVDLGCLPVKPHESLLMDFS